MIFAFLFFSFASSVYSQDTLKAAFEKSFLIGAALNKSQIWENDRIGIAIIKKHFNTISPENSLKWESIHPDKERYDFADADRFVEFGEENKMFIVGHTLIWHNQTPKWVFTDEKGNLVSRDELLKRMREHIHTVVNRYKGRVKGWDVVNEALNDDGTLRQSHWLKIIGEDYIAKAFEYAHEADPQAELYYNDFSLENEAKRQGAIKLLKKLINQKVPIKAVGLQGHQDFTFPTLKEEEDTIKEMAALGLKVMITELDIDVLPSPKNFSGAEISQEFAYNERLNPYKNSLPDSVEQTLTRRYVDLFKIYLSHQKDITRITFWGVSDKDSWKNNFPIRGRTNYPLLFDRNGNPKPALEAILKLKPDVRSN